MPKLLVLTFLANYEEAIATLRRKFSNEQLIMRFCKLLPLIMTSRDFVISMTLWNDEIMAKEEEEEVVVVEKEEEVSLSSIEDNEESD